ncbi:MAG: hypothetical protein HXY30_08725 [Pseudorhodoplanes sp.]|nr:hypothetical protein [Pseudorhodoplanes sp.]
MPAGNPDGGQWTDAGGGGGSRGSGDSDSTEFSSARQVKPGSSDNVEKPSIGHNQGPPLDLPPRLPDKPPASAQELNAFLKAAAQWIARARKVSGPVGVFLGVLDALSWLDTDRPFIDAYLDEPKSLEELQRAVSEPKAGYHIHHIIEQTSAEQDGFSRELIDGVENRVRISALKHWKITAWYATKNDDFGGLSPRDYLRGKSWDERKKVGYDVLVRFEVLKP